MFLFFFSHLYHLYIMYLIPTSHSFSAIREDQVAPVFLIVTHLLSFLCHCYSLHLSSQLLCKRDSCAHCLFASSARKASVAVTITPLQATLKYHLSACFLRISLALGTADLCQMFGGSFRSKCRVVCQDFQKTDMISRMRFQESNRRALRPEWKYCKKRSLRGFQSTFGNCGIATNIIGESTILGEQGVVRIKWRTSRIFAIDWGENIMTIAKVCVLRWRKLTFVILAQYTRN